MRLEPHTPVQLKPEYPPGVCPPYFCRDRVSDCVCGPLGTVTFLLKKCLCPPLKIFGSAPDMYLIWKCINYFSWKSWESLKHNTVTSYDQVIFWTPPIQWFHLELKCTLNKDSIVLFSQNLIQKKNFHKNLPQNLTEFWTKYPQKWVILIA